MALRILLPLLLLAAALLLHQAEGEGCRGMWGRSQD